MILSPGGAGACGARSPGPGPLLVALGLPSALVQQPLWVPAGTGADSGAQPDSVCALRARWPAPWPLGAWGRLVWAGLLRPHGLSPRLKKPAVGVGCRGAGMGGRQGLWPGVAQARLLGALGLLLP